jgi:hypothetical protein
VLAALSGGGWVLESDSLDGAVLALEACGWHQLSAAAALGGHGWTCSGTCAV